MNSKDEFYKKFPNFDWKYYIFIHRDLVEANINTELAALRHYINHGQFEERKICAPQSQQNTISSSILQNKNNNTNNKIKEENLITEPIIKYKNNKNPIVAYWSSVTNQVTHRLHGHQEVEIVDSSSGNVGKRVNCLQGHSLPGVLLKSISVEKSKKYRIAIIGQNVGPQNAFIMVLCKNTNRQISPNYRFLPSMYSRTTMDFFTTSTTTVIDVGVCFAAPGFHKSFSLSSVVVYSPSTPLLKEDIDMLQVQDLKQDSNQEPQKNQINEPDIKSINIKNEEYDELYSSNSSLLFEWSAMSNVPPIQRNQNIIIQKFPGLMQIINQQTQGTPGVIHTISVTPNTNYYLSINGYSSKHNNKIIVSTKNGKSLLKNQFLNMYLPQTRSDTIVYFNSHSNTTILIGVCFKMNTSIGQEFSISSMKVKEIDESIIPSQEEINIRFNTVFPGHNTFIDESPGYDSSPSNFPDSVSSSYENTEQSEKKELPVIKSIPQKIKTIEIEIFNLVESINDMNIDLNRTEKKLLKKIQENTKKSSD